MLVSHKFHLPSSENDRAIAIFSICNITEELGVFVVFHRDWSLYLATDLVLRDLGDGAEENVKDLNTKFEYY
jgi:hypothetical protein